jgi:hypothetical protein
MNSLSKATTSAGTALVLALLAAVAAMAQATGAQAKAAKPQDVPASVIAHVALPGAAGNQMLLQRRSGKQYLYIQQASKQGFMIVDVSKANRPNVLKETAPVRQATTGDLEMVGPEVALAETPEKRSASLNSVPRPAESVRVLDLTNPANPKTLQTFDGVTGILSDNGHIYLTNNEGLWILKYSQFQKRQLPPCDSESVFSPIADCK